MDTHTAELAFVEALRDATVGNHIVWTSVADDDREIYQAEIDGDIVKVEFVYFPVAVGGVFEKVLANVSGMKTYFQVATGTPAYHALRDMVVPQQSHKSGVKSLARATTRVRRLLEGSR